MGNWYMEIIDCRHRGSKTGKGAAYQNETEARAAFERARVLTVPSRRGQFLLDLHDDEDNLIDTIQIDAHGFEALIGEAPLSADDYDRYDADYWRRAKAAYGMSHAQ